MHKNSNIISKKSFLFLLIVLIVTSLAIVFLFVPIKYIQMVDNTWSIYRIIDLIEPNYVWIFFLTIGLYFILLVFCFVLLITRRINKRLLVFLAIAIAFFTISYFLTMIVSNCFTNHYPK